MFYFERHRLNNLKTLIEGPGLSFQGLIPVFYFERHRLNNLKTLFQEGRLCLVGIKNIPDPFDGIKNGFGDFGFKLQGINQPWGFFCA